MPNIHPDQQYLLDLFADNNTQEIEAKDLREFVNISFDDFLTTEDVVDNIVTISTDKPLSANQGYILNTTKENVLGNPVYDNQVLSSKIDGTREWITPVKTLNDLDDVESRNANDREVLSWNLTYQKWEPRKIFENFDR